MKDTASAQTQRRISILSLSLGCLFALTTGFSASAAVIWEAFNDYRPTVGVTHPNATGYDLRVTDDGGPLRNFTTGADLPVTVTVVVEGDGTPDDFGANSPVNAGSPADKLFGGKVDVGNSGLPGIRASLNTKLILVFRGLNPNRRYNFRGTVSRGGNYNDRWSVYGISGASSYVAAHEDGSANKNIITKTTFPSATLEPHQAALNSGENKVGSLVGWDNIDPGSDGEFAIEAQQYTGPAPFGNPAAAPYGYGFNAIYLAEVESTGNLVITTNPANQKAPAGASITLTVAATSPQAISYQWQKAPAGSSTFANIAGATSASYTTPPLTVADDGAKFRCVLTSGANTATSGDATIQVDGIVPTITALRASINLNAIHVTFSEPMKLEMLANKDNYQLSGGLSVTSATALDTTKVRLVTSRQTAGTRYTLTVRSIQDLAGNPVAANTTRSFSTFAVQPGFAGLEIWRNLPPGGNIQDLFNDVRYPAAPDEDFATTSIDSLLVIPSFPNNTYGGRFRAWITPEENGDYEFFIRADDTGQFMIATGEDFAEFDNPDRLPDATSAGTGVPFSEPGFDNSVSLPVTLQRGKRYAIQAIWRESNGEDYCQVAWRKLGDITPADQLRPIASKFLSYYGTVPDPVEPIINKIALQGGQVVIEWTGGTLQSSDDLAAWKDETGASSPLMIAPVGKKFYRVRN